MATTILDAVAVAAENVVPTFAFSSGSNRRVFVLVGRAHGSDANPPTSCTLGGVTMTTIATADDSAGAWDVCWRLFGLVESELASVADSTISISGGAYTYQQVITWSVQGAHQTNITTATGTVSGTTNSISLVRAADSYTLAFTLHDYGAANGFSGLANPSQDSQWRLTLGNYAYGEEADTDRTASFTWTHTNTQNNATIAINIPPAVADVVPPTLSSAAIGSNGTTVTLNFSEAITTGAGGTGGFVLSASGGAVTLSHSSTTGSSIVYTASRTIAASETATIAYTQPGNGVEDISGNDLATFSGTSVTNNSTQGSSPAITSVTPTAPLHLGTFDVVGTYLPTEQAGQVAFNFVGAIATVALGITFGTITAMSAAMDIGNNRYGVAGNLVVVNSAGTASANYAVTPVPRSGGKYINLSGTLAAIADRLIAVPDLAAGHQIEVYGVEGGTIDDVELFEDGSVAWALGVTGFWARAHNGTAWGEPAWQATVPVASSVRRYSISYSIRG